jgi:hypothetical protein
MRPTMKVRWIYGAVIGALALLVETGCKTPPALDAVQRVRWAQAWLDSLNSHRLEQVAPLLQPKGTYQDPLTSIPLTGPPLSFYFVNLWNFNPKGRYELRRVTGDAEFVTVEWSASDFGPTTEKIEGIFLLHVRGDHIASVRGYFDPRPMTTSPAP